MVDYAVADYYVPASTSRPYTSDVDIKNVTDFLDSQLQTNTVKSILLHHLSKQQRINKEDTVQCVFILNKTVLYQYIVRYNVITEEHTIKLYDARVPQKKKQKSKKKEIIHWYDL